MPKGKKNSLEQKVATPSPTTTPSLSVMDKYGIPDCYDFLYPRDYTEETVGLFACLLRRSLGDINFSALLSKAKESKDPKEVTTHFVKLLEETRQALPENDISIEKCLMLNRWIIGIERIETCFSTILSRIQDDMKAKLTNNHTSNSVMYPTDFRQREDDYARRKNAQSARRCFYFGPKEIKETGNLIYAQNKINAHLSCLFDDKMRFRSELKADGFQEMTNIFKNSFLFLDQPHSGANPVLIYERVGPGLYRVKVSVTIVSLLHEFIVTHPNAIDLYDIEVSLLPSSQYYQLEQPRSILWHTCRLHGCTGTQQQVIQYVELSFITIQQMSAQDTRMHFTYLLHQLQFSIRFRININDHQPPQVFQVLLESSPFIIGAHTTQIPQLLTRVILHELDCLAKPNLYDLKTIKEYLLRYFINRTGVKPNEYTAKFLEKELTKAMNQRKDFRTLEDIYMDALVPIVHQIDFMAKHPILAMLYADGLFIGPCNNVDTLENITKSTNVNFHKIALRFNSIKTDYQSIAGKIVSGRVIQLKACRIRVDIYNNTTKTMKYYTLDPNRLFHELSKLTWTAYLDQDDNIRILSRIHDQTNRTTYKSFSALGYYYHDQLREILKTDEQYLPLTNIKENIHDEISERLINVHIASSPTVPLTSLDNQQNPSVDPYISSQDILSLTREDLIKNIQSDPAFYADLIQQLCHRIVTQTNPSQASPTIILSQSNHQTPIDFDLIDDIDDCFEQHSTGIEHLQTTDSFPDDVDIDIEEFLTRDPINHIDHQLFK